MRGKSFSFDPYHEEKMDKVDKMEILQKQLGPCHLQRMLKLKHLDMTGGGLPDFANHLPNCDACQFCKLNRLPFSPSSWTASQNPHLIQYSKSLENAVPLEGHQPSHPLFDSFFQKNC